MKKAENHIRDSLLDKKHEFNPDALWDKIEKDIPASPRTGFDWSNIFILSSSIALLAIAGTIYFSFNNNKNNNTYKENLHSTSTLLNESSSENIKGTSFTDQPIVSAKENSTAASTSAATKSANTNLIMDNEEKSSISPIQKEEIVLDTPTNLKKAQPKNIQAKSNSTNSNTQNILSETSNHSISSIIIDDETKEHKIEQKKDPIKVFNRIDVENNSMSNPTLENQNYLHSKESGTLILGSDRNNIKKIGFYQPEDLEVLPVLKTTINSLNSNNVDINQIPLINIPNSSIEIKPSANIKFGISTHFGAGIIRSETIYTTNNKNVHNPGTDFIYEFGLETAFKFTPRWKIKSGILYQYKEYRGNVRRSSFYESVEQNFSIPLMALFSWKQGVLFPNIGIGAQLNLYSNANTGFRYNTLTSTNGISFATDYKFINLANNDISILLEIGNDFFINQERFNVSLLSSWSWESNYLREFSISDGNNLEPIQIGQTISKGEYLTLRLRYHMNIEKLKI